MSKQTELTTEEADEVRRVADIHDGVIRKYSGRGMYGEKCLAVVFTEMQHALRFAFGISPEYADGHLWLVLNHRPEVDDCGRGVVLYFRNVAPVVPIWDDEDDDC